MDERTVEQVVGVRVEACDVVQRQREEAFDVTGVARLVPQPLRVRRRGVHVACGLVLTFPMSKASRPEWIKGLDPLPLHICAFVHVGS